MFSNSTCKCKEMSSIMLSQSYLSNDKILAKKKPGWKDQPVVAYVLRHTILMEIYWLWILLTHSSTPTPQVLCLFHTNITVLMCCFSLWRQQRVQWLSIFIMDICLVVTYESKAFCQLDCAKTANIGVREMQSNNTQIFARLGAYLARDRWQGWWNRGCARAGSRHALCATA